ncbi:probable G-protein coupled receptor 139 isoform X1 [Stegostoma tigrinum]|uniref:probable G-protein coupled receptor 139 isoform X1 n=1 Tax=Stegostoma tigrinum TaxID=3053191 RepID=UPI00286FE800|nr:probable G-protein coupled receptor 139 isoform X1 [Stegostoma tigrinum]
MYWNLAMMDWNNTTLDLNRRTNDWNVTTTDWNGLTMLQDVRTVDGNGKTMGRGFIEMLNSLSATFDRKPLRSRIRMTLRMMQFIYYPILAIIAVPANIITIVILSQEKCGLSRCVSHYLVAMAIADLLVTIFDLILRHIPFVYLEGHHFLEGIPVCNIHAVLLYAATDCSVWFTVTFTFDRFVAICCPNLRSKYCKVKTAAVVLATVTGLSCLKNIFWYFLFTHRYYVRSRPWFCWVKNVLKFSPIWGAIEFCHYILTPGVAFIPILLLNVLTVRHIAVTSRSRRRLHHQSNRKSTKDPEMKSRKNSIILLFLISGNFILLWSVSMVYSINWRMKLLGYELVYLPLYVMELGYLLQMLSCCTNTVIYVITHPKFREHLKNIVYYPFTPIVKCIKH